MKALLTGVVALACAGCAGVREEARVPVTSGVRVAVDAARTATRKAVGNAEQAKASLNVAGKAATALLAAALPGQRPQLLGLQEALKTSSSALDSTLTELNTTSGALADSSGRIETLQGQIDTMAATLDRTLADERSAKAHTEFWRGAATKLGLLSLAMGLWTFRKPLLALGGIV